MNDSEIILLEPVCFYILKIFLKKLNFYLLQNKFFNVFKWCANIKNNFLIIIIIIINIILIHFK
jgi:hypothetical protein